MGRQLLSQACLPRSHGNTGPQTPSETHLASPRCAHGHRATEVSLRPNCWEGRDGLSALLRETSWTHAGTSRGQSLALSPPHPQPQTPPASLKPSLRLSGNSSRHQRMGLPSPRGRSTGGSELPAFQRKPTAPHSTPAPSQAAGDSRDTVLRKATWGTVLRDGTESLQAGVGTEGLIQGDLKAPGSPARPEDRAWMLPWGTCSWSHIHPRHGWSGKNPTATVPQGFSPVRPGTGVRAPPKPPPETPKPRSPAPRPEEGPPLPTKASLPPATQDFYTCL